MAEIMNEEVKTIKKASKPTDVWKDMVKIKLPRATRDEENFIRVAVNGRAYKVMKGIEVEVPKPIAEEIENSFKYRDKAEDYIASLVK